MIDWRRLLYPIRGLLYQGVLQCPLLMWWKKSLKINGEVSLSAM